MIKNFNVYFDLIYLLVGDRKSLAGHSVYLAESILINYIVYIDSSHKLEIINIMISLLKADNLLS